MRTLGRRFRRNPVAYLRSLLRPGDLCLTLGAGDLTLVPSELLGETAGEPV